MNVEVDDLCTRAQFDTLEYKMNTFATGVQSEWLIMKLRGAITLDQNLTKTIEALEAAAAKANNQTRVTGLKHAFALRAVCASPIPLSISRHLISTPFL